MTAITATSMSSFSQLKQQRKEKNKSYTGKSAEILEQSDVVQTSTSPMVVDRAEPLTVDIQPGSTTQTSYHSTVLEGHYGSLPRDLETRVHMDEAEKGRGIYNLRYRKPGDILLSIKPHVAALSNTNLEGHCSNCFGAREALRRCTGCKVLYYCDSPCQKADWGLHRNECAAIQKWMTLNSSSPSVPSDAIRCLGRILWNKNKLGKDSVWVREIDGMQSHRTSLNKDPSSQDSRIYAQLAHAVVRFLALNSPQEMAEYGMSSAADLLDLVSRFATNTFTISSPALAPLGACVSPVVALFNHSCDPNAAIVFPRVDTKDQEPQMQVVALKHISPNEEILTTYIDTTLPRDARQKQLRETYYFTCHCPLCALPANASVDLRQAMFCPKKCGGVCILPTEADNFTRCSRCKSVVKDPDAILDAVRIGQEALDKAEALQSSDPQKSIQLTTNLIPILTAAGLVPAAHPLLALSRLNATLLISNLFSVDANVEEILSPALQGSIAHPTHKKTLKEAQDALDEAIRAAARAFTGLSQILLEGHPSRGVALAELGKLLCVDEPLPKGEVSKDTRAPEPFLPEHAQFAAYPPSGPERLTLAYGTLVRALGELKIGFGSDKNEGGEVGKNVRKLAVDVEKELSVWREGIKNVVRDARLAGNMG